MRKMVRYLDDLLLIIGCGLILLGIGQWNLIVMEIVAGLMMIGFGVLIGKAKANNDIK